MTGSPTVAAERAHLQRAGQVIGEYRSEHDDHRTPPRSPSRGRAPTAWRRHRGENPPQRRLAAPRAPPGATKADVGGRARGSSWGVELGGRVGGSSWGQVGLRARSVYEHGSRNGRSTSRNSLNGGTASNSSSSGFHGSVSCSSNATSTSPAAATAVRISPIPWFHDRSSGARAASHRPRRWSLPRSESLRRLSKYGYSITSSPSGRGSDKRPNDRMPLADVQPATRPQEPGHDACPLLDVGQPAQRADPGVDEIEA